jgi:hypothetical protein
VETIGRAAFRDTAIESFIWPEKCDTVPAFCFFGCERLKGVYFPGPISIIQHCCFEKSEVKELDLTNSLFCDIDKNVLKTGIKIKWPFYQEQSY